MNKIVTLFILLFVIFNIGSTNIYAQANSASLSGYVKDVESNETIVGATVQLKGTNHGAYTNKSGFFSIGSIPSGDYVVSITSVGYEKSEQKLKFKAGQPIRRDFNLKQSSVLKEEVSVEAEREADKKEITVSRVDIPVKQLKNMRIGGEADIFRSLQYLPGILTSSQISSGLYIRGGSPDQNLVLLDGSTVYNPSHLFGFISTFNPDAIKDVELIKGGFPAEYGGRLSAVLNLTQKDGNKNNIDGVASLGAISSRLSLEGPIGNGSWFIGGRRTYLELVKLFIPKDPSNPLPDFSFYDINAKITQNISDNDRLFLSGFSSADNFGYSSSGISTNIGIENKLASGRWTHIFGSNLFSVMNVSASSYSNDFTGDNSGYEFLINNSITDVTAKASLEWFTNEKLTHKFGIEYNYYVFKYLQNFTGNTDSTQSGSSGGSTNLTAYDRNIAAFAQVNYLLTELISVQAGIRGMYWQLSKFSALEPRLAVRYQFQDNIAFKAAWGIYHQNLRLATQPDFSFFDTWLPTDTSIAPGRSIHYILSMETQPTNDYVFNVDLYYKLLFNINEVNITALKLEKVSDVFYVGNGKAYGVEFFLQKKYGRLTGWIGYALGYVIAKFPEINNGQEFRPKYDRRHDLQVVVQYQLSDRWDIGGTFTFQSGQSYTGATSRFQSVFPDENYGRGKIIPSERYGLRLPPSHQLNLNASYSFKTFGLSSKLIFDIYNVYSRRDIWFRYYNTRQLNTTVEDVRLLPIIPSISYEIKF
jgi:hypothetical protein